jgi:hypothetical protein
MAKRKVCVASSAGRAVKIDDFAGTTWGELKVHELVAPLLAGDYEVVVRPGNVTLGDDDSTLPAGEFRAYIIPKKNKSGAISRQQAVALGKEIADAIIKAAEIASDDEVNDLKNELVDVIEEHFNVTLEEVSECAECDKAIEEAKEIAG